jgi:hypothetical protein
MERPRADSGEKHGPGRSCGGYRLYWRSLCAQRVGQSVSIPVQAFGLARAASLGIEPGEWDSSIEVKNGRIVFYEWYYTPEFNSKLEQACRQKPDYVILGRRCQDFAAPAKAHTESARRK